MARRPLAVLLFVVLAAASFIVVRPASAGLFGDRSPDEYEAENHMIERINNRRVNLTKPEPALKFDAQIRRDARENSDAMASDGQFERPFTDARSPCATLGRRSNLGPDEAMDAIFREWLSHRETRACILDRSNRFGSVGVSRDDSFTYWVTFIGAEGRSR